MDAKAIEIYTVDEFYETQDNDRLELINGEIFYMAPPSRIHQKVLGFLYNHIYNYINSKGGDCEVYPAPFGVQLSKDENTVVEPDISVICEKNKLTDRGCLGAPDWIIEIASPSDPSHDYLTKLNLYMNAGVREYWIVDPVGKRISVYTKASSLPAAYDFTDTIPVGIYPDLSIDFSELEI